MPHQGKPQRSRVPGQTQSRPRRTGTYVPGTTEGSDDIEIHGDMADSRSPRANSA